jgi:hypothetical protein
VRFLIRHARYGAQRERPCSGGEEEVLRQRRMPSFALLMH